ncbi:putative secreted protein (Por secretion system target) [Nonlabens xylanidelens]|uniref:Putative secreted protein (Por secretion system target) n=1 Tax=Nonlabens xylanidelens TaxID=191564 RepID=A0A2S6IHG6_9FLAO|nr:LamG-like jellyroll fold domain-containing protein [Nonlabens xylanidelens]PPK93652.1 putative secreted protein (Por secretion system target) [Nonlabens xylanidelens]PQJ17767.1 hypothetical protein BST94_12095 [Nonlabens xylanidelens]
MKKTLPFLIIAFLFTMSANAQIPTGQLWDFTFTNGSLVNQVTPGTADLTTNNQTAVSVIDRVGTANTAYQMNSDYFINTRQGSTVNNQEISMSFWMKVDLADLAANTTQIFLIGGSSGFLNIRINNSDSSNPGRFEYYARGSVNGIQKNGFATTSIPSLTDDTWHHVALVSEVNGNTIEFDTYVDGVLQSYPSVVSLNSTAGAAPQFITDPRLIVAPQGAFPGSLDDIRYYERALTSVEVTALASENSPIVQPPLYVDANATGANDGSSWANAYIKLQDALDNANTVDVWVAAGTYKPLAGVSESFTVNNTKNIYGGFNGTETTLAERDFITNITRLSGDQQNNDTAIPAFNAADRSDNNRVILKVYASNTVIDGIYISGGHANVNANQNGAGALINKSTTINNCVFENNISYGHGTITVNSSPSGSAFLSQNNIIKNNLTGGVCAFYDNISIDGSVRFVNTLIVDNTSLTNSIFGQSSTGVVWINPNSQNGTAVNMQFLNSVVANNTYSSPNSGNGNANIRTYSDQLTASYSYYNCIFYGNSVTTPLFNDGPRNFDLKNSLSDNGYGISGINMITGDPLFVDPANGDYSLQSTSPSVDTGLSSLYNNQWLQYDLTGNNRIAGSSIDMGAYEFGATAGINDVEQLSMSLYPNPVTNIINIIVKNNAFAKAEVYNLQGQQILISQTEEVNVQDLKTGMYIIKVTTETGEIATKQFIKK